jgi:hypothetical protein
MEQTDYSRWPSGLSVVHCGPSEIASQTSSTTPRKTDRPSFTRGPSTSGGPSTLTSRTEPNFVQPKAHDWTDRTKDEWEHMKNSMNRWLKASSQPSTRGAWTVHMVRRQQLEPDLLKVNSSFPLPDVPNQPRDCYQIIGEGEAPLGDAIPMNS